MKCNQNIMNEYDVVLIDSGICKLHKIIREGFIEGISISESAIDNDINDEIGHGTAVCDIVLRHNKDTRIFIIKIFRDNELFINETLLLKAFEYILENIKCKVVNVSLGTNNLYEQDKLYKICKELKERGTIIICSYENNGAISYPAFFDNVIGVASGSRCLRRDDFYMTNNDYINVYAYGTNQRIAWLDGKFKMGKGNSLACAHFSGIFINKLINTNCSVDNVLSTLKFEAIENNRYCCYENHKKNVLKPAMQNYKKAIIFPFNKEMHSLIKFQDLLSFEIIDVYDIKYSGLVGGSVKSILHDNNIKKDFIIKSIDQIDWDAFDTIIIGHMDKIQVMLKNYNISSNLIDKAIKMNKYIYSYDPIYNIARSEKNFFPVVNKESYTYVPLGKLFRNGKPILSVFGTSSIQGKHTLQLILRRKFMKRKYVVGQLGTEPTDYLFGFDECFHFGYGAKIELNRREMIMCLNQMIHDIGKKDVDLIITGCQSGTVVLNEGDLNDYPLEQGDFIYGVLPDCCIVVINPYDELDVIERTINYLESIVECDVIALVVYPMDYLNIEQSEIKRELKRKEFKRIKRFLVKKLKKPIFILGTEDHMEKLTDLCINYFQE